MSVYINGGFCYHYYCDLELESALFVPPGMTDAHPVVVASSLLAERLPLHKTQIGLPRAEGGDLPQYLKQTPSCPHPSQSFPKTSVTLFLVFSTATHQLPPNQHANQEVP